MGGFKNVVTYCVAPVTTQGVKDKSAAFDMWVVGTDCCTTKGGDFKCGEYANPKAHSGVRIADTTNREYYQLAVLQAEAAYKINTTHPIFMEWVVNPVAPTAEYMNKGIKYFIFA